MDDNGLGYHVTCSCPDATYREGRDQGQNEIEARWRSADSLRTDLAHAGFGRPLRVLDVTALQFSEHEVVASKGAGNPGPTWYCKHKLAALRDALLAGDGLFALAFYRPDVVYPGLESVSVDGWLQAVVAR